MRIEKFLESTPLFAVYTAYDQIIRDFQKRLSGEGVHFLQALILTGIFFEERPVRPSELAATLRASRSNVSHALRFLERKGWVTRSIGSQDARAYFFTLTREGRKKVPRLIKVFDQTQEHMERTLGVQSINQALRRLVRVYRECDLRSDSQH